jgi:DNA-binding transcriptional MerR regulator
MLQEKVKRWVSELKAEGYAEGNLEGKRVILRKMNESGFSIHEIAEITRLPEEEIRSLIQSVPGDTVIREMANKWTADLKAEEHGIGYAEGYATGGVMERRRLLWRIKQKRISISEIAEITGFQEEEIRQNDMNLI